jgi:hypothetical protein
MLNKRKALLALIPASIIAAVAAIAVFSRSTSKKDGNNQIEQAAIRGADNSHVEYWKLEVNGEKPPHSARVQGTSNEFYNNESLEYRVMYPSDWVITASNKELAIGSGPKHSKTTFRDYENTFEIIIFSSNVADAGYHHPEGWTHSNEDIIIDGRNHRKSTLRNGKGAITRLTVIDLRSATLNHWIEVNFFKEPPKESLSKIDEFLKTFTTL